jgi:hypothetical protein
MRHVLAPGERLTVPMLQALLMEQQADGDFEGAGHTRRLIDQVTERERLRHQALRAGRWPFTVTGPKPGGDHE